MKTYLRVCAVVFGLMMTALCVVISIETVMRKVFNFSFEGVDELSGYAIAIGAPLCFAVAAIEQSHIRINLLYMRLPRGIKAALNVVAASLLAILSLYLLFFTFRTVGETRMFGSVAQTPWMTPLIWPQAVWLVGMLIFAVPAVWLAVRAVLLAVRRETETIVSDFGPDAVEDELAAELSDLEART